jgi:hypothetical protein
MGNEEGGWDSDISPFDSRIVSECLDTAAS